MRSPILIAIFMLFALMALASPATAACNHTTVYGMLLNRYIYQDTGFLGYDDPVVQSGITQSCDSGWWFDLFNSSGLSTRGQYGRLEERDYADEFDFTVSKESEFTSPLGAFQYQIFASYYLLSDFDHASDDIVELRAELARAFLLPESMMKITFSPYFRVMEFIAFGAYKDQTLLRPGLRISLPLGEALTFKTDMAVGFNISNGNDIFRSDTGFDYALSKATTLFTEVQTAEGVKSALMAGFMRTF